MSRSAFVILLTSTVSSAAPVVVASCGSLPLESSVWISFLLTFIWWYITVFNERKEGRFVPQTSTVNAKKSFLNCFGNFRIDFRKKTFLVLRSKLEFLFK